MSDPVTQGAAGRKVWAFRLAAIALFPALLLCLLELGLRAFGYGYATDFFVRIEGREAYTTNQRFGWQFFPRAISRLPEACDLPAKKGAGAYRIFVLGGSAALGTPDETFGFGRILEAMLKERYPGVRFEVVNAAMTAINSHVVLPIAGDCADRDADLFVVYMGNNEVVGPYGAGTVFRGYSPSLAAIRAGILLRQTRTGQMLEALTRGLAAGAGTPGAWRGMGMFLDNLVPADDPRLEGVYGHFRRNLADICEVARGAGAEVIVCTVATNLKDNAPFASVHGRGLGGADRAGWEAFYSAGIEQAEAGQHGEAVAQFLAAAGVDSNFADLHYRLGRCFRALGEADRARAHFIRARDLDALRFRADTRINGIIRRVASERASLVDAEQIFYLSDGAPDGLPGAELFYDHVHLNFDGNYLLARSVFQKAEEVLPAWVRQRASGAEGPPSRARCAELLALTGWDRGRMYEKMVEMMDRPPFVNQLDHEAQRALRYERLEGLRAEYLSEDGLQKAREVYRAALERAPDDIGVRVNFALLLEKLGEFEGAAEQWRILLRRIPGTVTWLGRLGDALSARGHYAGALAQYREAMRITPGLEGTHVSAGRALSKLGRHAEAEAEFRRALEVNPNSAEAHLSLASVLDEQGNLAGAVRAYRRALEISPGKLVGRMNLGAALYRQGDFEGAAEQYRRAVEIDPGLSMAHYGLGLSLARQGHAAGAAARYREALRLAPDWPPALNELAWMLATHPDRGLRDGPEAVALAELACRQTGYRAPAFLRTLAAAYAEAGRFEEAVRSATRAYDLARAQGAEELAQAIGEGLARYRAGEPFRE